MAGPKGLAAMAAAAQEAGQIPTPAAPPPRKEYYLPSGISKITDTYEDDPDQEFWIQFRDFKDRFKGGERKAIYAWMDEQEAGAVLMNLILPRRIALHIVHSWSADVPPPRPVIEAGKVVGYENEDSLDLIDTELENWVLYCAQQWMTRIAVNFAVAKEPDSPTKPSGD